VTSSRRECLYDPFRLMGSLLRSSEDECVLRVHTPIDPCKGSHYVVRVDRLVVALEILKPSLIRILCSRGLKMHAFRCKDRCRCAIGALASHVGLSCTCSDTAGGYELHSVS